MTQLSTDAPWSGSYVADAFGVGLTSDLGTSLLPVEALVGLALRRNPKRAHLLVSRVLAKHIPAEPGIVTSAALLLGLLVRRELGLPADTGSLTAVIDDAADRLGRLLDPGPPTGGRTISDGDQRAGRMAAVTALRELLAGQQVEAPGVVTIGYAETATGLGQLVAAQLGTYYIHSTRHNGYGIKPYGAFEEAHSHATSHQLLPTSRAALNQAETVILVDDELSLDPPIRLG